MNNNICIGADKCKDCEDEYTEVLKQVLVLPFEWQLEIVNTIINTHREKYIKEK